MREVSDVFARPRLARFIDPALRDEVLVLLDTFGAPFEPTEEITASSDPKDDKYLALAVAAGATATVTGDGDLLARDPFRGVRILKPAEYLVWAGAVSG